MQMELFKNYLISAIRTLVPFVVGVVTAWLTRRGITLDDDVVGILTLVLEGLFGMAYYLAVRGLEHLNYRFGWLLGYARMPVYTVSGAARMLSKSDDEEQ